MPPRCRNLADVNQLFFGDNLQVLREHLQDESVDLTPFAAHRPLYPFMNLTNEKITACWRKAK